jgi:hypothetical protein
VVEKSICTAIRRSIVTVLSADVSRAHLFSVHRSPRGDQVGTVLSHRSRTGVGAAVSVLGWVLVALGVWLLVSVPVALVLARLVRSNCVSVLDVLPERHRREADPLTVPSEDGDPDGEPADSDLPAPRSGAHDEAEAAERRRPSE